MHITCTDLLFKNCWLIASITIVTIFGNFGNLLEKFRKYLFRVSHFKFIYLNNELFIVIEIWNVYSYNFY